MNHNTSDLSLPEICRFLRENPLALTRILADLQNDLPALNDIVSASRQYSGDRRAEAAATAREIARALERVE